jgi:NADP-dependent 3-hydroxy acid dehydrogenase YdfG
MTGTAIIAGVGRTIGESVARRLHGAGYDVGLFARSESFIDQLADDLGAGALAVPTDITDTAAVEAGVETVREAYGPISVLVLNATGGGGRPVEGASVDRLESIFAVRVGGSLACVQAAREDLQETEGTVIFSGTTFADPPVTEQIEWGAVAPAAKGLSTSLAAALENVQVTYVRIGSSVVPETQGTEGVLTAADVADRYLELVERERVTTREVDLYSRQ